MCSAWADRGAVRRLQRTGSSVPDSIHQRRPNVFVQVTTDVSHGPAGRPHGTVLREDRLRLDGRVSYGEISVIETITEMEIIDPTLTETEMMVIFEMEMM